MSGKIFISYRRREDSGNAGRLFDRLKQAFSPDRVFMDVDRISAGDDFGLIIEEEVARCDVLLIIIGKDWADLRDDDNGRKLDNPSDFVRLEIEAGLRQGKRITPVLTHEAKFPKPDDLPDTIKPLARRHYVQLRHERYEDDVLKLVSDLRVGLERVDAARREATQRADAARIEANRPRGDSTAFSDRTRAAASSVAQPQPAAPAAAASNSERKPNRALRVALVAGLGVVALVGFLVWRPTRPSPVPTPPPAPTQTTQQQIAPIVPQPTPPTAPAPQPKSTTAAKQTCPSTSQGTHFNLSLSAAFTPDPYRRKLTPGGGTDIAGCRPDSRGWVSASSDVALVYGGSDVLTLTFEVKSDVDTVLLINDPSGAWLFDDDSAGDRNPRIRVPKPRQGRYDIWIGTYETGKAGTSTELLITER